MKKKQRTSKTRALSATELDAMHSSQGMFSMADLLSTTPCG
jgi:hypothetical protein